MSGWTFWRNSFLQGKKYKFSIYFPITGGKNLALCRNFSSVFVITAIFVSTKTFRGKLFLLEELGFLILLRPWAKNFRPSYQKFSARVIKTAFYVSIGTTWWKSFDFSSSISDIGENFSSASRKKLAGISELLSKSPYEIFSRKTSFPETIVFLIFSRFDWKLLSFLLNFSEVAFKTAIYKPIRTFEENCFSWIDLRHINFQTWVETCYTGFCSNFPSGLSKLLPTIHTYNLEKKILEKIYWKHTISGNLLLGFSLKVCGGVVNVAFYKTIRTFQLKTFHPKKSSPWCCSELSWSFFAKLLEYFQQGCWNCNLRVNSKNLIRNFLNFFSSLSHIGKTISSVYRKFSDEVVKNFIFLSRRTISWKIFSEICVFFSSQDFGRSFTPFPFWRDFSVAVV